MTLRDIPAALWLVLILVVAPWSALEGQRRRRASGGKSPSRLAGLDRPQLYRITIWGLAQILIVTVLLDWIDGWPTVRASLAFPSNGWWWVLLCVAAHQIVSLTSMTLRRIRGTALEAGTALLLPTSAGEYAHYAPVALAAGISEEFVYRGFALAHLMRWGVAPWLAVAVVTLSFGLAHGYKSLVGMLRTSLVGVVVAVPVLVTRTLLPSMIAHTIMDLLAGAIMRPLARRLGVKVAEPAA